MREELTHSFIDQLRIVPIAMKIGPAGKNVKKDSAAVLDGYLPEDLVLSLSAQGLKSGSTMHLPFCYMVCIRHGFGLVFKIIYLFISERRRERESMHKWEEEREGQRERILKQTPC